MKRTKTELVQLRESSYTEPGQRCESCLHFWHYGNNCQLIEIRGRLVPFKVSPSGTCDLHTPRGAK